MTPLPESIHVSDNVMEAGSDGFTAAFKAGVPITACDRAWIAAAITQWCRETIGAASNESVNELWGRVAEAQMVDEIRAALLTFMGVTPK